MSFWVERLLYKPDEGKFCTLVHNFGALYPSLLHHSYSKHEQKLS